MPTWNDFRGQNGIFWPERDAWPKILGGGYAGAGNRAAEWDGPME